MEFIVKRIWDRSEDGLATNLGRRRREIDFAPLCPPSVDVLQLVIGLQNSLSPNGRLEGQSRYAVPPRGRVLQAGPVAIWILSSRIKKPAGTLVQDDGSREVARFARGEVIGRTLWKRAEEAQFIRGS